MNKIGKILIVDDYPNWRKLLSEILLDEGYTVAFAENSKFALDLIQRVNYDILILDIRLDDENKHDAEGFRFLRQIRKSNSDIKVVILTGYPDIDQKKIALEEYGAAEYLSKTDNIEEFKPLKLPLFSDLISRLLNNDLGSK
jgi:CheY-like chemotaxis protein